MSNWLKINIIFVIIVFFISLILFIILTLYSSIYINLSIVGEVNNNVWNLRIKKDSKTKCELIYDEANGYTYYAKVLSYDECNSFPKNNEIIYIPIDENKYQVDINIANSNDDYWLLSKHYLLDDFQINQIIINKPYSSVDEAYEVNWALSGSEDAKKYLTVDS